MILSPDSVKNATSVSIQDFLDTVADLQQQLTAAIDQRDRGHDFTNGMIAKCLALESELVEAQGQVAAGLLAIENLHKPGLPPVNFYSQYQLDAAINKLEQAQALLIEEEVWEEAKWWEEYGSDRDGELSDIGRDRLAEHESNIAALRAGRQG